ncbi:cuticle protein 16.8-like [Centruroides sculpturatus]|uniref:cuticle protein 16.8-like n=1 Tax=Centruroides sculpturatus TaxID=218467 RepID=UPI000C6EB163|nr:cuticle protein 16.8-like [Centruroides sculpturatus]
MSEVLLLFLCFVLGICNGHSLDFQKYPSQPYDFGYSIYDKYGNRQHREEKSDEKGTKIGSYGYTDSYGIYRHVDYIADENGFRAIVRTNEHGTAKEDPADVHMYSENSGSQAIKTVKSSKSVPITHAVVPTKVYSRSPMQEYVKKPHKYVPVYVPKYHPRYVSSPFKRIRDQYSYIIAQDQALQSTRTTDLPLYRDK